MSDTPRTLFNPDAPFLDTLRREWVELDQGWVCVREMQAGDTLFVNEHSQRGNPGESSFGIDLQRMQMWQVISSCYQGEEPGAPRTFKITDMERIKKLRGADWLKLQAAIERVNGFADSEVAAAEAFTGAGEEPSARTSSSGASKTSIASPVS